MEGSPKPWLFRLYLEHTPSPHDPEGSDSFYQALGTLVVAFGRLESHFLACVLAILATDATKGLSSRFPMAWEQRLKIWEDAFRTSPVLTPHEPAAIGFLREFKEVIEDRNKLVHGFWERLTPKTPVSANLVVINRKKGTKNGIDFWRGTVSTDQINNVARKADRLNIKLQMISSVLTAERGLPPSDVYIP
jgi:hypothetical protein